MNSATRTRILTFFMLLPGVCLAAPAEKPAPSPQQASVPVMREMRVDEPIFKGQAVIYEGGAGNPRSVVLVHGVGDNAARDWDRLIPELVRDYHVLTFDLPGFGRSSKGNEEYTITNYARFLRWVIPQYVRGPFTLIGHSFGGSVALKYAADYPDDLERLVLVDAAGILHHVVLTKNIAKVDEQNKQLPERPINELNELIRSAIDTLGRDKRARTLEGILYSPLLRNKVLRSDPKRITALSLVEENYGKIVDKVRTPTLILWGGKDTTAPVRSALVLDAMLPRSRLVMMPQAGHSPMLEQTASFNKLVVEELRSAVPPEEFPEKPQEQKSERIGKCDNQRDMLFTGAYALIEVNHCEQVRIVGVTAGKIVVTNSKVEIENSIVRGSEAGLVVTRSEVIGTDLQIDAEETVIASRSRLDLAGVKLTGTRAAVSTPDETRIIFSVSRLKSPHRSGMVHESLVVTRKKPL
ncbi:MAG TPA: alpha/beta hydrolase [Nitrospirota bacterium]|nr:alpha/beta hydrolase [Nitrospirota bacterium]